MFTKLGRDEVLMARHMHKYVLAVFAQGRIQGKAKQVKGGGGFPFLKKLLQNGRLQQQTEFMHSNDLEACVMKCCCFWFHSVVKFLTLESSL